MSDLVRWFETRRSPIELFERLFAGEPGVSPIRVEEAVEENTFVVRAELPGIDPDKDVEVTMANGLLSIKAQREEKKEHKDRHSYRSEFRYGSFVRHLPLPDGVSQDDITASYKDGVLEVRAPMPEKAPAEPKSKIQITKG